MPFARLQHSKRPGETSSPKTTTRAPTADLSPPQPPAAVVQAKLRMDPPDDHDEQLDPAVPQPLVRMRTPKVSPASDSEVPHTTLRSAGQPLPAHAEESRARAAVASLAASPLAVSQLGRALQERGPAPGAVGGSMREAMEPHTGPLPFDLKLRTGPEVDRSLTAQRARGLAHGNELWVGGPHLTSTPGGFATVLVHEAAHVASGASQALNPPYFDWDDSLGGGWYEAQRERAAALEAAETGEGRQQTLDRLAGMSPEQARREAPGIAFRAQDRGDVGLATAAADRLLRAWLESTDAPVSFTAGFGPDDSVDALLERADAALTSGQIELGGKYLAISMVQLVRAARVTILRRGPIGDEPGMDIIRQALLPLQRAQETDILERVERVRELLESHGSAAQEGGDAAEIAQFEAMAEDVHTAERQAGPALTADLGSGGVVDAPAPPARRRRGATAPTPQVQEEAPPSRPSPTTETPVSRAAESIVNSSHPELEGALVFHTTTAPMKYGNVRSPRYAVAGTLAGAHRMAGELFGRRSCVIVEEIHARDEETGARQIRYLVLALNTRLNPPSPPTGEADQIYGFENLQMLTRPASRQYFFLAITSGSWQFFAPTALNYIQGIRASELGVEADTLSEATRRAEIFGPVDRLIEEGETQEAANQLTYVGSSGFSLLDTATKVRYLTTMLRAFTFEAHERTIVEVFRSMSGTDELRDILHGLHREGVLLKLHTDMESAFPALLMTVGQKSGASSLSSAQVRRLLSELRIFTPFPGIEVRADGSVTLNPDVTAEFVAAVEQLITTLTTAVTGIVDIFLDPEAFVKGIGKLLYFGVMAELSRHGYPPATRYVQTVIAGIGRQLGAATHGLAVLQENMPADVEFVRHVQRSTEWRIIWEVVGLFVGVGEAVALVDAIRGGRAVAAISDLASGLGRTGRAARATEEAAEAARLAERGAETAEETADAARRARGAAEEAGPAARRAEGAAPERLPEIDAPGQILRAERVDLGALGSHRVVVSRVEGVTQFWLCTHCSRLVDRIDGALAAVSPTGPTRSLHTRLTRLRERVAEAERGMTRGTLTVDDLPAELNQVGAHLRDLSRRHPDIAGLAPFRDLPFSPEMRRFIRETSSSTTHVGASTYSRGKHVRGTTNAQRQANSAGGDGQYFAELGDGTRVTDAVIERWEREGLRLAREGRGRVEVRGASGYHCYVDLGFPVGYADGVPTRVMRVEWTTGGHVHSHPRPASDL